MSNTGGDSWQYVWDTTGMASTSLYTITINATDKSPNLNEASNENTDIVNVTSNDFTDPVLVIASDLSNDQVGTVFTIWADVTDNFGIGSVTAYIQSPDGTNNVTITLLPTPRILIMTDDKNPTKP